MTKLKRCWLYNL